MMCESKDTSVTKKMTYEFWLLASAMTGGEPMRRLLFIIGGHKKMAASIGQIKPLEGEQAKKFIQAFETSQLKEEAIERAIKAMKSGFTKNK